MLEGRDRPSHIIKDKTGPDDPELQETLSQAMDQVSAEDLVLAADQLAARHEVFAEWFGNPAKPWQPSDEDKASLFSAVAYSKKKARGLGEYFADKDVSAYIQPLLSSEPSVDKRVEAFVASMDGVDTRLSLELATGILHYTHPTTHWLWTRWMWDPGKDKGILPLTAGGTHNLVADTIAEGYVNVGSVSAMSARFAEGTGLISEDLIKDPKRTPFAVDVFLAASYCIYLYGVTSWRLSREFNNLLPTLPDLMRKLLGLPKSN